MPVTRQRERERGGEGGRRRGKVRGETAAYIHPDTLLLDGPTVWVLQYFELIYFDNKICFKPPLIVSHGLAEQGV